MPQVWSLSYVPAKHDALARYSVELFADLAGQTGQETGYQTTGSMTVALHAERWRNSNATTMANAYGVNCELSVLSTCISTGRALKPATSAAVLLSGDGQTNPVDTTPALAKGALAVRKFSRTLRSIASPLSTAPSSVCTDDGTLIKARQVVLAAGMWSRELPRSIISSAAACCRTLLLGH